MKSGNLLKEACEKSTLIEALSWGCLMESERAIKQAHKNLTNNTPDIDGKMWDTCFEFVITQIMENYKGEEMKEDATNELEESKDEIVQIKEMLEEKHNAKLIPFIELDTDLKNWLFKILRHKSAHEILLIFKNTEGRIEILMYTEKYEYAISANEKSNYLGCTCSLRKKQAGEHWTRGSDLPDGKYNKETCDKIVNAIISNELVKLELS